MTSSGPVAWPARPTHVVNNDHQPQAGTPGASAPRDQQPACALAAGGPDGQHPSQWSTPVLPGALQPG